MAIVEGKGPKTTIARLIRKNSLLTGLLLLMCACGDRPLYSSFHSVGGRIEVSDILFFKVDVPDSITNYRADMVIRYNSSYPYDRLYLNVGISDSIHHYRQVLVLRMVDEKGAYRMKGAREFIRTRTMVERGFVTPGKGLLSSDAKHTYRTIRSGVFVRRHLKV